MATVDEVRAHVHEVAAITECYAMIRDEMLKACREHGHEEYKDGLYRAMQLLMKLRDKRQDSVSEEMEAWALAARRELRIYAPCDPREAVAVVIH